MISIIYLKVRYEINLNMESIKFRYKKGKFYMIGINELTEFVNENEIENKIINKFEKSFQDYIKKNKQKINKIFTYAELKRENISNVSLFRVFLEIDDWLNDKNTYIIVLSTICDLENDEIGYYKLFYNLTGEYIGDEIIIDAIEHNPYKVVLSRVNEGALHNFLCVDKINQFVKKYEIEKQIINCFWKCFNNYKNYPDNKENFLQSFSDYEDNLINICLDKVSLQINEINSIADENIVAHSFINFKNEEIGYYKLFYNLSGEIIDDVLVIY